MGSIGNLSVGITATNDKFSRVMKSSREEATLFGKTTDILSGQVTHLFGAMAAGFTIHKVYEEIKQAREEMVEIGHASKRLDVGTEALGGLEHAATLAHVSAEELTRDLTFMEKNVGNNKAAFDKLGLSVANLRSLKADEMFIKIAGAIEKLPNASEKTAATLAIFGKGGAGMLNLMNEGPGEIRAAMAEAGRMGLAPSEDDIKKIEEEDRAIRELGEAWKGTWHIAALYFADYAKHAAEAASFALGGDAPGDKQITAAISSMPDKQFQALKKELSDAEMQIRSRMASQWLPASEQERQFAVDSEKRRLLGTHGFKTTTGAGIHAVDDRMMSELNKPRVTGLSSLFVGTDAILHSVMDSVMDSTMKGLGQAGMAAHRFGSSYEYTKQFYKGHGAGEIFGPDMDFGDLAEINRISNSVNNLGIAGNAPIDKFGGGQNAGEGMIRGNAALQYGTAAAFSQEKRSQQSGQWMQDIKTQTKTQLEMSKSLQSIDKNLKTNKPDAVVNIA